MDCDTRTGVSPVRTVVAVAALVVLASATATVGAAAEWTAPGEGPRSSASPERPGDGNESRPAVVQTVRYDRTPAEMGTVRVTHRYRVGQNASSVVVYDYDRTVVLDSSGFERRANGRLVWNGAAEQPSVTFRVAVNQSGGVGESAGLEWADTRRWSLTKQPVAFAYRHAERDGWAYSWRDTGAYERVTRLNGRGYAGSAVVYLGPHELSEGSAAGQQVRLVRPVAGTNATVDQRAVLDTLTAAAKQLRVGARDDVVNAFVGPEPLRAGGVTSPANGVAQDFWVAANRSVSAPANLWIHEYVHTRQNSSLGPSMAWFGEASATYYAGLLSVRQGVDGASGFDAFVDRLRRNATADAVLTDRSTWETEMVPYRRGARVLAALDARIRAVTGENRTLQHVFRRVNAASGPVTYDQFAGIVANVTGGNASAWLADLVAGSAAVTPPSDPWAYTAPSGSNDANGDGLTAATERALGTHPFEPDADGLPDELKLAVGTSLRIGNTDLDGSTHRVGDTDLDGSTHRVELAGASDPVESDSTPLHGTGLTAVSGW